MAAWQIVLAALGGVLLLLLLLLLLGRAKLRITYRDGFSCVLNLLGIKKSLVAKKASPAPPDLDDLTDSDDPEREILKKWAQQKKKLEKAKQAAAKKAEKKAKKAEKKKGKHKSGPKLGVGEILPMAEHLLREVFRITKGRFRLKIHRIFIAVASDDAAKTAVLYGTVSGALAALLDFLDANYIPVKIEPDGVRIESDFLSEKPRADLDMTLSITLWRALGILFRGAKAFLGEKSAADAHAKARLAKKKDATEESADNTNETNEKG